MNTYDDDYPDEDVSGDEVMAAIFAVFAYALNPSIDREVAYDLLCQAMDQGGISLNNAHKWGNLIRQTTHGVRSNAKH